jgi:MFS transporter, Spinster family, sphingosine-1-phosphate transporter
MRASPTEQHSNQYSAVRPSYRNHLLFLLMVILAFNYVDRLALGVVLEDIKIELDLSDTQLGFLSGIAFALFYSVMGIPIARWADRGNRVLIIAVTVALWSAAVALSGMARSFVQLLLIRIGVAVGEAGCIPPAHSLIADYYPRAERPRAAAIYSMGAPLALVIGYFVTGWLNEFFGWRMTFMILGAPGLVLAVWAWLALVEPRRRGAESIPVQPPMREVWIRLWANKTFRYLLYCLSVSLFFTYGILQWLPAFFIRQYGLQTGVLGTWLAASYGLCGLIGNYWGGTLASRYAANNEPLQMRAMAVLYCCVGAFSTAIYLAPNYYLAFAALGVANIGLTATNGPILATIQTLVPPHMRATSIALVFLFANLIGMGLGPLAAGALSDALHADLGHESLRFALLLLSPGYLWCAWHVWRGSQTVASDINGVEAGVT